MTKYSTSTPTTDPPTPALVPDAPEFDEDFEQALQDLAAQHDLDELARSSGALLRRRGVSSALQLLRLLLAYSVLDYSLRRLGAWGVVLGLTDISKTALLKRLRKCRPFLGLLVMRVLLAQQLDAPHPAGLRGKLFDATVICQPGSRGSDYRLHLGFDLGQACIEAMEVTDGHGGESLTRFTLIAGVLAIVDRGYATLTNLAYALSQGAWVVVRNGWRQLPLEAAPGQALDVTAWLQALSPGGAPVERPVWVTTQAGRFPLRLVACALPEAAAERARQKVRRRAQKKGHRLDERSRFAAGYLLLVTNLPATWSMASVLQLYRFRWQVELAFRRLKSLLNLDGLRTKDPELAQVYLLAKLLAALLVERQQRRIAAHQPDWFTSLAYPLSLERLTQLLWESLCQSVRGTYTWGDVLRVLPKLQRFLCDEKRNRVSQRALAQRLFGAAAGVTMA